MLPFCALMIVDPGYSLDSEKTTSTLRPDFLTTLVSLRPGLMMNFHLATLAWWDEGMHWHILTYTTETNDWLEKIQPWMRMYLLLKKCVFSIVMLVFGGVFWQEYSGKLHHLLSIWWKGSTKRWNMVISLSKNAASIDGYTVDFEGFWRVHWIFPIFLHKYICIHGISPPWLHYKNHVPIFAKLQGVPLGTIRSRRAALGVSQCCM